MRVMFKSKDRARGKRLKRIPPRPINWRPRSVYETEDLKGNREADIVAMARWDAEGGAAMSARSNAGVR
jgi:hypothetical protein